MNEYQSIRAFSKCHRVLSERQLRQMIAEGKVPGIRTKKGFKINVGLFLQQLEEMSRRNATGGVSI